MSYLEELLPEFRKGAKIRRTDWDKNKYIYFKNGNIYDNKNLNVGFTVDSKNICKQWELYQEPIDWNYIIKYKCPCWFWDDEVGERKISTLDKSYIESNGDRWFIDAENNEWLDCRPVRRIELTFYEDREDEM